MTKEEKKAEKKLKLQAELGSLTIETIKRQEEIKKLQQRAEEIINLLSKE